LGKQISDTSQNIGQGIATNLGALTQDEGYMKSRDELAHRGFSEYTGNGGNR